MIIIFAAFRNEVKGIIKKIRHRGTSYGFIGSKNNVCNGYLKIDGKEQEILICITGLGADNAMRAAEKVMHAGIRGIRDAVLLVLGISGSTDERIKEGDIVIYNRLLNLDFLKVHNKRSLQYFFNEDYKESKPLPKEILDGFINLNHKWQNDSYKIHEDSGACVPFLIGTYLEKLEIGRNFNVSAVDMESYHIARIAGENKIPFGVIRAISDDIFTEIPDYLQDIGSRSLRYKLVLFARTIFSVAGMKQIIRLLKGMKKAADNLNDFVIKEIIPFIHKKYFLNYK